MNYPKSIQNLIHEFSQLPTVGPKTAERYVFYLLQQNNSYLENFAQVLSNLKKNIKVCAKCFAVSENGNCEICLDKNRIQNTVCVVTNTRDLIAIESIKQYDGLYHVLGGLINTIRGIGPEKLSIKELENRIDNNGIEEIILGLSPTIEGETTAMYIAKIFKNKNIKITKLARGLASGSDLEYADQFTLFNALKNRTSL